jgi:selenide, water dikinase
MALAQALRQLPRVTDPKLLVGADTGDDAGVYRLDRDRALVCTADFLTPVVDDPFVFGQIAAANSLSDVYAMGARPLCALNLVGFPEEKAPPSILSQLLLGGCRAMQRARCLLMGGHTIRCPELFYGLSVTGMVSPRRLLTNAAARPGDLLVLTKPLGSGIVSTGIKRDLAPAPLVSKAIAVMKRLNSAGMALAESGLVRAATDVTGFGLVGHLGLLCQASEVGAEIWWPRVPVIARGVLDLIEKDCVPSGSHQNLLAASGRTEWSRRIPTARKLLLADAQTSGGLLVAVPPRALDKVRALLAKERTTCAVVVGRIVRSKKPVIQVIEG